MKWQEPLTKEQMAYYTSAYFDDMRDLEMRWAVWTPSSPTWDHDHCTFCGREISADSCEGRARVGYVDATDHAWVCERCFEALKHHFGWVVKS